MHHDGGENTVIGWGLMLISFVPISDADAILTVLLHLFQIGGIIAGVYYTSKGRRNRD